MSQHAAWSRRQPMSIVDNAWFFVVVSSLDPSGHHVEICCNFNVMGFSYDRDYPGFQTRPLQYSGLW
jgi:hypothetical protein